MTQVLDHQPPRMRRVFLVTVIVVCLLSNLGILIGVNAVTKSQVKTDVVGDLGLEASAGAARAGWLLEEKYEALQILADLLAGYSSRQGAEAAVEAAFLRSADFSGIVFRRSDGDILAGRPIVRAPSVSDDGHSFVRAVRPSMADEAGNGVNVDFDDGLVTFGFPVRTSSGVVKGFLEASLNKNWLAGFLAPSRPLAVTGKTFDLLLVDDSGTVLIGPPELEGSKQKEILLLASGRPVLGPDQSVMVAAEMPGSSHVPSLGWRVVAHGDESELFSLIDAVRRAILLSTLPVLLFCVLVGYLLVRKISRPIEALTEAVDAGVDIPNCDEFNETAKLAKALGDTLKELQQEKERVELQVRQRTAELEDMMRVVNAHAIISMADENGIIVDCNDQFCAVSGYSRSELIGQSYNLIRTDRHSPEFFEELERTVNGGRVWQGLICNRSKSGELLWMQSTISPAGGFGDSRVRRISIRTDITSAIQDRQKLAQLTSELMMFRRIIDHTSEGVSVMDRAGRYIYCNPARERMTGVSLSALKTMRMGDGMPDSAAAAISEIREAVSKGGSWAGSLTFFDPKGREFISHSNVGVVADENGFPQFIFNIFQDQTQRLTLVREMEAARNSAEQANKAKSEFLSNMSHELRTPLNAILGFAQILMIGRKNPLDERQVQQVRQIIRGGEHLLELITEVLDMAKIEAGRLSLSIEPISARELLEECIGMAAPVMSRHQIALNGCECADLPTIMADRVRTKQVLLNLLSNAAKYNKAGGSVSLACEILDDGFVRFNIEDTGNGIADEKLRELFIPFSRLGAETTDIEGTGIGLALSKKLMEAMGGRIGASSRLGIGSRFWLDFPVTNKAVEESTARTFAPAGHETDDSQTKRGNLVLYVEDNPSNIKLMEGIFDTLPDMFLITAMNAELGLDIALSLEPTLIIMDVNLPGMSGIEAVHILKRHDATASIPVIALSADATKGTIARGKAAGFDAYLTKPVDVTNLIQLIKRILGNGHD